jgi:hypothetical protein
MLLVWKTGDRSLGNFLARDSDSRSNYYWTWNQLWIEGNGIEVWV